MGLCAPFAWRRNALEGNDFLSNRFSCFCAHPVGNPTEFHDTSDHQTFKKMLPRDERRFKAADLDGDQTATREEFTAFLHPEEFEHMKEIVVLVRQRKSPGWEFRVLPGFEGWLCYYLASRCRNPSLSLSFLF